jgi:hypothetical protein
MLQSAGGTTVVNRKPPNSISAQKPKREGGHSRAQKRRGAENVLWKRVTASFDDAVKRFSANPAIVAPLTRLVFFKHLTVRQGMAGRRYADVMRTYERYHVAAANRTPRAQNLEPVRGRDQEIERHIRNGTMAEYEADARAARRAYKRMMKVLATYADPATGRNIAKDVLDNLCLSDIEPPAQWRGNLAVVLTAIADEFAVMEKR